MVIYKNSSEFSDYIGALVEERKKIQVFERELPLCLDLVSQAIERCRQQSFDGQSDRCSYQTSSECPVLEEFIPMKLTSFANEVINDQQQQKQQLSHKSNFTCNKNWLASAQLSLQAPDPPIIEDNLTIEEHKNGCNNPLKKEKTATICGTSSGDTAGSGGGHNGGSHGEAKGPSNKKERRSWSPELHRLFLHALQQLGGAHVATPKQIRELMKVNGLTNEEIKSHLQKYRLHTRRLNPTIHNDDTITPQLVVLGRIWIPPLDYTTNVTSSPYK